MRSSFFVILSIFVHALCVAAIAITPTKISPPEGQEIEVQVGTPAEQPGIQEAPQGVTEAAAPVTPPPAPVEEKPLKIAKASTRPTRVVKAPMEKVTQRKSDETKTVETKVTELPAKEALTEAEDDKLDPEIEETVVAAPAAAPVTASKPEFKRVKESAPAGVEASDEETEATSGAKGEDPAPAEATGKGEQPSSDSELAHGGATKAGAVSYLDLKQAAGNKSPSYPLQARREARQGQVELLYRVTKEGKVADMQVAKSSGYKDLDQEAARAVAQFKFVPGQEGWARHPVAFNLKGVAAQAPSRLRSAQTE